MLKHKEAIHARAWDALDWRALAQHQFGLEAAEVHRSGLMDGATWFGKENTLIQ